MSRLSYTRRRPKRLKKNLWSTASEAAQPSNTLRCDIGSNPKDLTLLRPHTTHRTTPSRVLLLHPGPPRRIKKLISKPSPPSTTQITLLILLLPLTLVFSPLTSSHLRSSFPYSRTPSPPTPLIQLSKLPLTIILPFYSFHAKVFEICIGFCAHKKNTPLNETKSMFFRPLSVVRINILINNEEIFML